MFFFICIFAHLSYLVPENVTLLMSIGVMLISLVIFSIGKVSIKRFVIILITFMLLIPSLINSEEENILIPLMFFILPFLPFVFSPNTFLSQLDVYLLSMRIGVLLSILGVAVQIFISPDLFGLPGHPTYSGELMGTSNFRPTGFTGSPQNLALFMSVGLFYKYSNYKIINFLIKLIIFVTGASTLSTFFAGAVFVYLLFSIPLVFIIGAPFVINYLWFEDFSNTKFEFLSISEIGTLDQRFMVDDFFDSNFINFLIGYGPGTATQGMIDRFYVQRNLYGAESFPLIILHEFGFIFTIFLLCILTKIIYNSYFIWRTNAYNNINILAVTIILVTSIFLTPNFASFRIKMIFIPIFLISLIPIITTGKKDFKSHCSIN